MECQFIITQTKMEVEPVMENPIIIKKRGRQPLDPNGIHLTKKEIDRRYYLKKLNKAGIIDERLKKLESMKLEL